MKMKGTHFFFLAALLAFALCAGRALAAEGDYILKNDKVYRTDGGKERLVDDSEFCFTQQLTDKGAWAWVLVDPALSDAMKGSEGGVYFFRGEEHAPAGFIPVKDAGVCQVEFSPSGEKLFVSCGTEGRQDLGVYSVDEGGRAFARKASYPAAGCAWWADPHRFLLTVIDESKGRRSKAEDDWWRSAALYDTAEGALIVIRQATETEDYSIVGCDNGAGTLDIVERSVENAGDWNDEKKIRQKEMKLPIPAAG